MSRGRTLRAAPLLIPFVVAGLVPAALGLWLPGPPPPGPGGLRVTAGLVLALIGAWMNADAVDRVYLRQPTPLGDRPPERLVRSGWYGVIRNPMAAGMTLLLTGEALLWSATAVLVWAAFVLTVSCVTAVRVEEPGLRETFAEQYAAYRRAVPGWIPGTAGATGRRAARRRARTE
ncbi:methyltransferase family protein [Streptomyces sp. NPDC005931]|uniref:methyltransferase family protein n=1 Tax=Streptomyces sp. NPDC005931 TaxID=3364737 RepID=UPI003678FE9A